LRLVTTLRLPLERSRVTLRLVATLSGRTSLPGRRRVATRLPLLGVLSRLLSSVTTTLRRVATTLLRLRGVATALLRLRRVATALLRLRRVTTALLRRVTALRVPARILR
jgi:hypothetical protein